LVQLELLSIDSTPDPLDSDNNGVTKNCANRPVWPEIIFYGILQMTTRIPIPVHAVRATVFGNKACNHSLPGYFF
jgi:hypothetical protein